MTVRKRAIRSFKHLSVPVSYRVLDENKLSDARNVFDNKGITETRYGLKRYNTTSLGGPILSASFFKTSAGVRYKIVKVGTVLYSVAASGAHTSIKTGLSATTKHRAVTLTDRHIIAIESDGLFSYNGTIFTQLGQLPPTTGSVAVSSGGSLTDANTFKVGLTFYASSTGFETNVYESAQVTTASPNKQIDVTSIPTTASNGTINKVRVYLKNVTSNSAYLFVAEISLGTATYTISATPTSTLVPPTKNAPPISGGAKFISLFGKRIVIAGNSTYLGEAFVSEEYLPDAFNNILASQVVLQAPGQGAITGIATGVYSEQYLSPFLAIFKKTTTTIYSELGGIPSLVTIDENVGCISNDTIKARNGMVAFMSNNGWHLIVNGTMAKGPNNEPMSLGGGAIDDIFSRVGWSNELNIPQASSFFSAYHFPDALYMTFVCEGGSTEIKKAYVYEERIMGFRVFDFQSPLTCATEGEDDSGYPAVFIGDSTGTLFTYSTRNSRHDEDYAGNSLSIPAFAMLPFIQPGEDSCSYNLRTLAVRALSSANLITVKAYPNFNYQNVQSNQYDFANTYAGFTLDVSQLDSGILSDERVPVTAMADINITGEVFLIGFYQDIIDGNLGLISVQASINKNGNRNV